jgi:hypothetical protein
MNETKSDLDKDLARLRGYVVRLGSLVATMEEGVKFDFANDHMGFMALSIVSKQLEHLKSICVLVDAQQYRDSKLITRTMVEGLALIYWAAKDPKTRPLEWRACSWVEEFARLYGTPHYPVYKKEIETMLSAHCTPFLKPSSKHKSLSEITPNDYTRGCRWEEVEEGVFSNVTIKKIFQDAGLEQIYQTYYADTSNWTHWNPIGIGEALQHESDKLAYGNETKYLGALAYITGFNVLLQSARFLNDYFKMDFNKTLDELYGEFCAGSGPT